MSKAKQQNPIKIFYDESKHDIINKVREKCLEDISSYLRSLGIRFGNIINFINNPIIYPGSSNGIVKIVTRCLYKAISQHYFELQQEKLPIKIVFKIIFDQLFRKRIISSHFGKNAGRKEARKSPISNMSPFPYLVCIDSLAPLPETINQNKIVSKNVKSKK